MVYVEVRDKEVASQVGASVRAQAQKQGWTMRPEGQWGSGSGTVFYQGTDPDLEITLTLSYREDGNNPHLTLYADAPCMEMPDGHKRVCHEFA